MEILLGIQHNLKVSVALFAYTGYINIDRGELINAQLLLTCTSLLTCTGGELIERDGKKYKIFYGMSSTTAMKRHAGGVANYRFVLFPKAFNVIAHFCLRI